MLERLRRIEQLELQIFKERENLGVELREKFDGLYKLACQKLDGKDLFRFRATDSDFPVDREVKIFFPANAFFRYLGFENLPPSVKFHLRQEHDLISSGEEDVKEFFDVIFGAPTEQVDFYSIYINHWRIRVSLKSDRVVPSVAILDEEKSKISLTWN